MFGSLFFSRRSVFFFLRLQAPAQAEWGTGGWGEAPASAAAAGSGAAYEYGDVVTVIGLQSKPQHNGKVAKVLQRQKDRFQVQIQDDAMASMALRPSNLEPEVIS